jgi:hypothetical protein
MDRFNGTLIHLNINRCALIDLGRRLRVRFDGDGNAYHNLIGARHAESHDVLKPRLSLATNHRRRGGLCCRTFRLCPSRLAPWLLRPASRSRLAPWLLWPAPCSHLAPRLLWPAPRSRLAPWLLWPASRSGLAPRLLWPAPRGGLAPWLLWPAPCSRLAPRLLWSAPHSRSTPWCNWAAPLLRLEPAPNWPGAIQKVYRNHSTHAALLSVTLSLCSASSERDVLRIRGL